MFSSNNRVKVRATSGRERIGRVLAVSALIATATVSLGQGSASAQGSCHGYTQKPSPAPGHETVCDGGWTAWIGGGNTKFMGALNSWNYPVTMSVITGGGTSGGVRYVCVGKGHILWEDSSVAAAGVVVLTTNSRIVFGAAAPCTHVEV